MVNIMTLSGRIVGLLLAPGFDFAQITRLLEDLRLRDADILLVGNRESEDVAIPGGRAELLKPDTIVSRVDARDFDALIIPGGTVQGLAMDGRVLTLLLGLQEDRKPIAAYGNGPLALAAAGLLVDRRVAAPPGIRETLTEAGADYVDQELVVDHKLVTSRTVDEITHFVEALALLLEPVRSMR